MFKSEYKVKRGDLIFIFSFLWIIFLCFMMVGYSLRDRKILELNNKIDKFNIQYKENLKSKDSIIYSKNKEIDSLENYLSSKEYLEFKIYEKSHLNNFKLSISRVDYNILKTMIEHADKNEIPYTIYFRLIDMESGFNFISNKKSGARGYMQLMPKTFRLYYKRLDLNGGHNRENNIIIGSYMLKETYNKWMGRINNDKIAWEYTLAEYNTGIVNMQIKNEEGKVMGHFIPNYTKKYINFIMRYY